MYTYSVYYIVSQDQDKRLTLTGDMQTVAKLINKIKNTRSDWAVDVYENPLTKTQPMCCWYMYFSVYGDFWNPVVYAV